MAEKAAKPVKTEAKPTAEPAAAAKASAPAAGGAKKKDNTLKIVLIVVGVLVGLAILGTIATILFFGALFDKATDGVNVDGNGTVTYQSDDGQTKTNFGENAKLAEGWPSDVPIYEPSTLVASTKVNNDQFSATAKTSKPVADVTNYYKEQMAAQGWTTSLDSSYGDGTLLTFAKDNRTASVSVTNNPEETSADKTAFVVSVTTQQ